MDGNIVLNMINNFDKKPVTLPCYNTRPWKLPVYWYKGLGVAQASDISQFDLQKIFNFDSLLKVLNSSLHIN